MAVLSVSTSSWMPLSVKRSPRAVGVEPNRVKQGRSLPGTGRFSHLRDVLRKDAEYLKKKIDGGIRWANDALHLPQVSKTLEDIVWLRNLEDHVSPPMEPQSWPQPFYPELSGADLFMADLKALEAYAKYFYCLSKIWTKPLPEVYDPQAVADYFSCRPHVVAFRLLEVFSAFMFAAARIQTSRSATGGKVGVSQEDFGMTLKETMLNLGPTFIKVGQSLSTRPDIFGTDISKALSELHDQIPPFPRRQAMKIVEQELGSPAESFFRYLSQDTIGAASFAQVYRGITHDGLDVAVKVQRPDLRHAVMRDVYILRLGLGLLRKVARRKSDLSLYADELGKGLVGELDYRLEAANASEFLEAHSRFPFIRVPKVYDHLSHKRVLTMEWIAGESPRDLLSISVDDSDHDVEYPEKMKLAAKERLMDLVNKGVEATLVQLLETGLLHADPHPGNLRYTLSGQIGFLDFGLVCRMERKHQLGMLASIVHIANGDWGSLVQALAEMGIIRPETNLRRVTMDLENALGEVEMNDGIPDVKFSRVLGKIISVAVKYHFQMPPYFTLLLRSLASFEGLAIAGNQKFKTFEAAYPFVVQKLLTENSFATRKILYSVVLNRRKEFQWNRLARFLKMGSTRKSLQRVAEQKDDTSIDQLPKKTNQAAEVANLIMQILPSKDGVVLRRLLMTADGASLARAVVSRKASSIRQQLCRMIAEVLYRWMSQSLGTNKYTQHHSGLDPSSGLSPPGYDYQVLVRDKRLKVIFLKVIGSVRKDPILMVRFCLTSLLMLLKASALACHRFLTSLPEAYTNRISLSPKRAAIST